MCFVDLCNDTKIGGRPIGNMCLLLWAGVIAPIALCLVLYAIYVETERIDNDH